MPTVYYAQSNRGGVTPSNLKARLTEALPFEPESVHGQSHESHLFYAWTVGDGLADVSHVAVEDGRAAAMSGYASGTACGKPVVSAGDLLSASSFDKSWGAFDGEWSGLTVDSDGIVAGSSPVGTEHVYVVETDDFTAVSNRARLLWAALAIHGQPPSPDFQTLASLLALSYPICTDRTAVEGVRHLRSTEYVAIDGVSGDLQRRTLEPLYFLPDREARPDWEALTGQLVTHVDWLAAARGEVVPALTGGKDSRLVLAALRQSEYGGRVDHFYLRAPENHADVITARRLAERFDLDFRRRDRSPDFELFEAIRRHVDYTEGLLNAWDLKESEPGFSTVGVHGLLGEVYRRKTEVSGQTPGDLADSALPDSSDTGRLLADGILESQRRRVADWYAELADEGLDLADAADVFYLRQRIPRWMGQAKLHDGLCGYHFNPLFGLDILQTYYTLPDKDRTAERIHFELMADLDPELAAFPFARASWKASMVRRSSHPDLSVSDSPIEHRGDIIGTNWQRPALASNWPAIRGRILDRRQRFSSVVRPDRLEPFLDVAPAALGLADSIVDTSRAALCHPILFARAKMDPVSTMHQIFGLLTLDATLEAIADVG